MARQMSDIIKDGGQWFPRHLEISGMLSSEEYNALTNGASQRTVIAAMAMQGILSCHEAQKMICDIDPRFCKQPDGMFNFSEVVAKNSVEFADALLKELEK